MRLLETLKKKRDHHLQMAQKFAELIAVLAGDPDLAAATARHAHGIVNGARAKYAAELATVAAVEATPAAPTKPRKAWTAAARRHQAKLMRDRWKDPKTRRKLLKGLAKAPGGHRPKPAAGKSATA